MFKNVSGQKIRVMAFTAATGLPLTGDAANITCKVSIDNGTATALADTNPTETEDGYYLFDLTKAETNGNTLDFYPESATSGVVVLVTNHDRQTVAAGSTVEGSLLTSGDGTLANSYAEYYGGSQLTDTAIGVDANGSISVTVGSTELVSITCNQTITTTDLTFLVETKNKTDVATVTVANITRSGTTASLRLTSAMTSVERTLRWSMVKTDRGEGVAGGLMFVTYDAGSD